MARYRATIQGNRSQASRLGHARGGIHANVNGWHLGVNVWGHPAEDHTDKKQETRDRFDIDITGGSGYASRRLPSFTVEELDGDEVKLTVDRGLLLNEEQTEALRKLIDYNHDEEQKHYDADPVNGHIFESIGILAAALNIAGK